MGSGTVDAVFFDISSVIEYCCVYFENNEDAITVIDNCHENDVKMVVSEGLRSSLNDCISDRNRLYERLVMEAEEHMRNEGMSATDYRDNVLCESFITEVIDGDLNQHYLSDIEELREEFNTRGLKEFKNYINDVRIQANQLRFQFETVSDLETCERASDPPWHVKASIDEKSDSDMQTQCFIDYGYWRRRNYGPLMIGSLCAAAEYQDKVISILSNLSNDDPSVLTPTQLIEMSES
jgi:hypothetical protein